MNLSTLIVGLGNPGPRYRRTRHNLGFMVVDAFLNALASDSDWRVKEIPGLSRAKGFVCEKTGFGPGTAVLKPSTYMNRSGLAVAEILRKNMTAPERVLTVHDELDLEPGTVRMKMGGGLAGHNGLRSVAESLGTREFPRVRMGIGRPLAGTNTADYVLEKLTPGERQELPAAVNTAIKGIIIFLEQDFSKAQQWVNSQ
ncbi:MAG: aminoacyl-tRNA hydrolase [Desulfonatronovibrionaceae bacterium]